MEANVSSYSHEDRLVRALALISLELTLQQRKSLLHFLATLDRWNRTYNLTAVRDLDRMLVQHLFDCLAPIPILARLLNQTNGTNKQVWDIGSGAGLPGIVMAIAWLEHTIHTVDAVAKKIAFQQHVIGELGLSNVRAQHCRVEHIKPAAAPDLIVCRAFTSLAQFANACAPIAQPQTILAALKGKLPNEEIEALPKTWQITQVSALNVPELDAERHLIIMRKT